MIMMFAYQDLLSPLFDMVFERGLKDRFVWVGTDSYAGYKVLAKYPVVLDLSLGVQFQSKQVEEFDNYFFKFVSIYILF